MSKLPSWATDLPTQLLGELRQKPVLGALATVGTLWAARQTYDLASFLYVQLLHENTLSRFANSESKASWALITGASDGIGKGFAEELCQRGFNVILHGRNESKLNRLKDELLKQWPERELRTLVLDATADARDGAKMDAAARSLNNINLTVLASGLYVHCGGLLLTTSQCVLPSNTYSSAIAPIRRWTRRRSTP